MKIAFLNSGPSSTKNFSTSNACRSMAMMLGKLGDDVMLFAMGEKEAEIKENFYTEKIVRRVSPPGTNLKVRIMDIVYLTLFKKRYSSIKNNQNRDLISDLKEFAPEIIISFNRYFVDLLVNYKKVTKVKLFAVTDDISEVCNAEKIREDMPNENNKNAIIRYLKIRVLRFLSYRLINFYESKYDLMLREFNKIIFFTKEDMKRTLNKHREFKSKLLVIPPSIEITKTKIVKPKKVAKNVLFVGNYTDMKNVDAIRIIKEKIAPATSGLDFIVAGKGGKKETYKNFKSLGPVKDIGRLIDSADICIVPLRYGTGIKIKILDFLSHHKPVVGTSIAFEGFDVKNGKNAIICDDLDSYPRVLNALAIDYKLRKKISDETGELLNFFSDKRVSKIWLKLLDAQKLV